MKRFKIYLIGFLVTGLLLFIINFITSYFGERVGIYIKNKATVYSVAIMEKALREEVIVGIDSSDLVVFQKNDQDVITNVNINTSRINDILANVNNSVVGSMEALEEDELSLPLGIIISDTLFGSIGPNFNISLVPMGRAVTDVVADVSPYGINSSLLEVSINVKINVETIIPLRREQVEVSFNIPLVMQVINSDVPLFYVNG